MTQQPIDPAAIDRTGELMGRARRIFAYGGFDGVVRRPLYHEAGVFPQFAASAEGCEIVDTTGQRFVDWVNGWGPVVLGYRHPEVEEAIRSQLAAGPTLSLMHEVEVEVAELLNRMVPCAEMVAFAKNGSDATTAAVRVARAVTGKRHVLHYGMHGFQDWFACTLPHVRGLPDELRQWIHPFPYNDVAAVERLFEELRGDVAAVVMEPVREILPEPGYLEALRALTKRRGALLVWDEIVTVFRLANGGAQELYGVVPDLACLGKSMANGMPLAALVGRREFMQVLPSVGFGMTFRGETLSLAAARATLRFLCEHPVAARLAETGRAVRGRFEAAARERGLDWRLSGPPARQTFVFPARGSLSWESLNLLFLQETLKRGVLTNGNLLASWAHDAPAIERTSQALAGALDVVREALEQDRIQDEQPIGGALSAPRAWVARGFVEELRDAGGELIVAGWLLLDDGPADEIRAITASGAERRAERRERDDLARAFPGQVGAREAGFSVAIPRAEGVADDFTLLALRGGRVAFRCRVVRRRASNQAGPFSLGDGVLYL